MKAKVQEKVQEKTEPKVADNGCAEAPASVNFYGITRKGWNCQFTLRDADEMNLLTRFGMFVTALEEEYGVTPKAIGAQAPGGLTAAPQSPAPSETKAAAPAKANGAPATKAAPVPVEERVGTGEEVVTFQVDRIEAQTTPNGKPQFKVFGGPFSKFGVTCWPEIMAEQFDLDSISVGDSWSPAGLTVKALKVDGKVKKVIGFVA